MIVCLLFIEHADDLFSPIRGEDYWGRDTCKSAFQAKIVVTI